jgi:hypothetical protein
MKVSDMVLVRVESAWRPNIVMPWRSRQRDRTHTLMSSSYRAPYRIEYGIVTSERPSEKANRTRQASAQMDIS